MLLNGIMVRNSKWGMALEKKRRRLILRSSILAILGIALAFTVYANFTKDQKAVSINQEAPDFVLTDLQGEQHKLSDYKGQGVFLNFWGTWCKPCTTEMPAMNNQYAVYRDQGVQILAVNVGESKLVAQKFAEQYGLDFPILLDNGRAVETVYDVFKLPVTFLIDQEGNIVDIIEQGLTEQMIQQHMESIKP